MENALLISLQVVVFTLGAVAVCLSVYFIHFFSKAQKNKKLGATMQFFLGEQIVTSVGTMIFASSSLLGALSGTPAEHWNAISPPLATSIRVLMFVAMIISTYSLSVQVKRISRRE